MVVVKCCCAIRVGATRAVCACRSHFRLLHLLVYLLQASQWARVLLPSSVSYPVLRYVVPVTAVGLCLHLLILTMGMIADVLGSIFTYLHPALVFAVLFNSSTAVLQTS